MTGVLCTVCGAQVYLVDQMVKMVTWAPKSQRLSNIRKYCKILMVHYQAIKKKTFYILNQKVSFGADVWSFFLSNVTATLNDLPGLWLTETFSTTPLQPLNEILQKLIKSKYLMSSTKFVFWHCLGKQHGRPGLIGWFILFTFPFKTLNEIQWKLTVGQAFNILYQVYVLSLSACVPFQKRGIRVARLWPFWLRVTWSSDLKKNQGIICIISALVFYFQWNVCSGWSMLTEGAYGAYLAGA